MQPITKRTRDTRRWMSHDILQPLCNRWLRETTGRDSWFPGPMRDNFPPKLRGTSAPVDVVLFGDFAEQLCRFSDWPYSFNRTVRIWVLCGAAREVCESVLGIPRQYIGVIPRSVLFPQWAKARALPKKETQFDLVYSGRFIETKNFDIFLQTASALQTRFGFSKMSVEACGSYTGNLEQIAYLTLRLPWITPPRFVLEKGPNEWLRIKRRQPVAMNLSCSFRDDFGVSIAQARAAGWPCVLSNWGGFRDVKGRGVLHVPHELIAKPGIERSVSLSSDYRIPHWIAENWTRSGRPLAKVRFEEPISLSISQLAKFSQPSWKKIKDRRVHDWFRKSDRRLIRAQYERSFGGSHQ